MQKGSQNAIPFALNLFSSNYIFGGGLIFACGTIFFTGLVDFKKAKIASRSSSYKFLYAGHGIGGRMGLVLSSPLNFPSRITFLNCSSVHIPMPVESLLIFPAYDCPHGPIKEVKSGENNVQPDFNIFSSVGGKTDPLGCPPNRISGTTSGPCGPIFFVE